MEFSVALPHYCDSQDELCPYNLNFAPRKFGARRGAQGAAV